jgi:hypothetical protein
MTIHVENFTDLIPSQFLFAKLSNPFNPSTTLNGKWESGYIKLKILILLVGKLNFGKSICLPEVEAEFVQKLSKWVCLLYRIEPRMLLLYRNKNPC